MNLLYTVKLYNEGIFPSQSSQINIALDFKAYHWLNIQETRFALAITIRYMCQCFLLLGCRQQKICVTQFLVFWQL